MIKQIIGKLELWGQNKGRMKNKSFYAKKLENQLEESYL